jgi:hypothetical protein
MAGGVVLEEVVGGGVLGDGKERGQGPLVVENWHVFRLLEEQTLSDAVD